MIASRDERQNGLCLSSEGFPRSQLTCGYLRLI